MRTTVGRVWAYIGVLTGLSVSLAGNVAATYLDGGTPSKVDILAAGLPPFAVFIAIELLSRNPWGNATWGPKVQKVIAFGVAPPAAIISFVHLVHLTINGKTDDPFAWVVAILTPLMIDGLLIGSTAALLLPKGPASKGAAPADVTVTVERKIDTAMATILGHDAANALKLTSDLTGETQEALAEMRADAGKTWAHRDAQGEIVSAGTRKPVVSAHLSPQRARTGAANGQVIRERYRPREHPLWDAWVAAHDTQPWTPDDLVLAAKQKMGKDMTTAAAATMMSRWEKELASPST